MPSSCQGSPSSYDRANGIANSYTFNQAVTAAAAHGSSVIANKADGARYKQRMETSSKGVNCSEPMKTVNHVNMDYWIKGRASKVFCKNFKNLLYLCPNEVNMLKSNTVFYIGFTGNNCNV